MNLLNLLTSIREHVTQYTTRPLGSQKKTWRGFPLVEFCDYYKTPCSLQASSLALHQEPGVSAIWLGCDDAKPQVLASKAASLGHDTTETTGWVPYPIPEDVSLTTRMHLDREQVAALINHLQTWMKTGQFACAEKKS